MTKGQYIFDDMKSQSESILKDETDWLSKREPHQQRPELGLGGRLQTFPPCHLHPPAPDCQPTEDKEEDERENDKEEEEELQNISAMRKAYGRRRLDELLSRLRRMSEAEKSRLLTELLARARSSHQLTNSVGGGGGSVIGSLDKRMEKISTGGGGLMDQGTRIGSNGQPGGNNGLANSRIAAAAAATDSLMLPSVQITNYEKRKVNNQCRYVYSIHICNKRKLTEHLAPWKVIYLPLI